MPKLKAILFDLDGTLRDTRVAIYEALEQVFKTLELPSPTQAELAPYVHHHSAVHEQFAPGVARKAFGRAYGAHLDKQLPSVQLYEHAEQLLQQLHDAGYKVGIVTAAPYAREETARYNIGNYIDTFVTASDVVKPKPDPESVNLALKRLNVAPVRAVMIGDMAADIQAGHAAGLAAVVGITHGFSDKESLVAAGADHVIGSLDELLAVLQKVEQA
jgi:HAD superfamily hydrolase (TIGR01509 family)